MTIIYIYTYSLKTMVYMQRITCMTCMTCMTCGDVIMIPDTFSGHSGTMEKFDDEDDDDDDEDDHHHHHHHHHILCHMRYFVGLI